MPTSVPDHHRGSRSARDHPEGVAGAALAFGAGNRATGFRLSSSRWAVALELGLRHGEVLGLHGYDYHAWEALLKGAGVRRPTP